MKRIAGNKKVVDSLQRYLRFIGQEGIGRPDLEGPAEVSAINRFIKKQIPEDEIPEPNVALVFTNEKAELEVENASHTDSSIKRIEKYHPENRQRETSIS